MVVCLYSPALCISTCGHLATEKLDVIKCRECSVCQCSQDCSSTRTSSKKCGGWRRISKPLLLVRIFFVCVKRGNKMVF